MPIHIRRLRARRRFLELLEPRALMAIAAPVIESLRRLDSPAGYTFQLHGTSEPDKQIEIDQGQGWQRNGRARRWLELYPQQRATGERQLSVCC